MSPDGRCAVHRGPPADRPDMQSGLGKRGLMPRGLASGRHLGLLAGLGIALSACAPGDGRQPLIVYSPHGPDLLTAFETRF
jgi:hypothetical protein